MEQQTDSNETEEKAFSGWMARPMTHGEFFRYSEFIGSQCGIKMPLSKKIMLEARLQKRLRTLGIKTFGAYYDLITSEEGRGELIHMLDAVTTNKTDFFREPVHFQYLTDTVLPAFMSAHEQDRRAFLVWSAGCSTGEEPYTLAIVLSEFGVLHPGFRFSILATDLSTRVLDRAKEAIYDADRVAAMPLELKKKYLLRSKDPSKNQVRIIPELRSLVRFQRLNFMKDAFVFGEPLDVVFCRNVIIYFDRTTQERLLAKFCRVLQPGGYLFLGHSESIHGFDLPLKRIVSTVYRRIE